MADTVARCRRTALVGRARRPEHLAQSGELPVVADRDHELAVARPVTARTARCSDGRCPSGRDNARDRVGGALVDERGEQRGEQVDLDPLPVAGRVAVTQRRQDPDRGEQAGEHVDERDADLLRLAVRRAR